MTEKYEDIINLPHHVSKTRPQMSMLERAAQFSPFAALNGYDDAVKETGRLTDERIELGDEERDLLDRKQQYLQEIIADRPEITVTFFVPDEKKPGGSYTASTGNLPQPMPCPGVEAEEIFLRKFFFRIMLRSLASV